MMQDRNMCGIAVYASPATMRLVNCCIVLCLLFFHTEALNCKTEGGPKQSELKNIYYKCLKMQDGKNSSNSHDYGDQEWKDQGRSQRNDWNREQTSNNRGRSREERSGSRSDRQGSTDGRMGSYDERDSTSGYRENSGSNDGMESRIGRDNRMGSSSNRMGGYGNNREGSMSDRDSGNSNGNHGYNGRNDFQHDDYGSEMSNQYGYQSSTQSPRRYKRERHTENSGQRSQFNPNSSKKSSNSDSYQSDEKSSKENNTTKDDDKKACALHCFLENLEMTAEDGMPDRYLVTHTLTKDVTNEDLKDFLQESIEECFQMLDNENTEDKCQFSKNLLMCLSEKGRANCDDWKDDLRF